MSTYSDVVAVVHGIAVWFRAQSGKEVSLVEGQPEKKQSLNIKNNLKISTAFCKYNAVCIEVHNLVRNTVLWSVKTV